MAKYRAVFDRFDADGTGGVSTEELSAMLKQLGISKTDAEIATMMAESDPDGYAPSLPRVARHDAMRVP